MTVYFIGAGPGVPDLLTVRASRLLTHCGTCLYAGSGVPPKLLATCPPTARLVDTARMTPGDVVSELRSAHERGDDVARLHPGDPSAHPDVDEQIRALDAKGIPWEVVPGVTEYSAAAAAAAGGGDPSDLVPSGAPDGAVEAEERTPTDPVGPEVGAPASSGPGAASASTSVPATPEAPSPSPVHTASHAPSMPPGRILVLGGTSEGRQLADRMVSAGLDVVTSLAGHVPRPRLPRGQVRIGGFSGPDGLARWLVDNDVSAVIDAAHPFAGKISVTAISATGSTGTPLLRLHRPAWSPQPDDDWIVVPDMAGAARVVRERYGRPMLTVGRRDLGDFAGDSHGSYLIRCVDPPDAPLPDRHLLVLDRGPFSADSERTLMARHRIDVLVTRNSGGEATEAKLEAARLLRVPVVMVNRPVVPAAETVHTVDDAARWLVERFGSH